MAKPRSDQTTSRPPFSCLPERDGLYDPRFEHDACGVSFVADIKGRASHDIVATALSALCNLDHRGAQGAEPNTGDGAGILVQVPDEFLRACVDFELPAQAPTPSGCASCPPTRACAPCSMAAVEAIIAKRACASSAGATCPSIQSSVGKTALERHAQLQAPLRRRSARRHGHRPGSQGVRRAQALRARADRRRGGLFPVAVVPHADLQGHADHAAAGRVLPGPRRSAHRARRWRWCTAAFRPTPSRPGRWRTRTA